MSRGEDPAGVTERLRELREKREELEDEILSIRTRKEALEVEKKSLLEERARLVLDEQLSRLCEAVTRYNAAAPAFAEAVTAIRGLLKEIGKPGTRDHVGSPIANWRELLAGLRVPVLFAAAPSEAVQVPKFNPKNAASSWHLQAEGTGGSTGTIAALTTLSAGGNQ